MKTFSLIADLGGTALFQNKAPGSLFFPVLGKMCSYKTKKYTNWKNNQKS